MLVLPIKKKWFDLVASGVKKEEYREIKPYYTARFQNIGLLDENGSTGESATLIFRNGYSGTSPAIMVECILEIGEGNPAWGAIPGEKYYILKVEQILK